MSELNSDREAKRIEIIAALRDMANTFEIHPELPIPYMGTFILRVDSAREMLAATKAFGGKWSKEPDSTDFNMRRITGVPIVVYSSREKICHRVVTGTKHIPAEVLPAREETIIPAKEVEIVEWLCPESLNEVAAQEEREQDPTDM